MIFDFVCTFATIYLFFNSIFKIPETSKECSEIPLSPPKFKKLIYILVDGLRFDAFVPVKKEGFYYNNFSFTKNTEKLKTTFLSVSGIPTATTCRVIGMMTGAPSNQIEELLTFFTSSVSVESLLDKFKNRKMMFYGDEVWETSFKELKHKSCSISGFSKANIEQVEIDLIEKIKKDKESEIKFIHLLSLDALGHSYGTEHAIIKKSLLRADNLIDELYGTMDDDTLLVVTSDHGVTNEGAHGGNSKYEIASTCGFYSKKFVFSSTENFSNNSDFLSNFSYNSDFLSKFYDLSEANTDADFIKAAVPYKIIHQDDILPTIAYFMGIATPMNSYGNIIPYLVDDYSAQKILKNQKKLLLNQDDKRKHFKQFFKNAIVENYALTNAIYLASCSKNPLYAIIALFLGIFVLVYKAIYSFRYTNDFIGGIIFCIATIFVSHSYFAFASEDLIWFLTFLITNFSFSNLVFLIFFIKTPGRKFFEIDRFQTGFSQFKSPFEPALLVLLFIILKFFKFKKNSFFLTYDFNILNKIKEITPQLAFILYNYTLSASFDNKLTFLLLYPSLDSLLTVHFQPLLALNFILFLKNLDFKKNQSTKNILLALVPFLLNLEKVNQSIDYDVFIAYSFEFCSLSNFTGVFTYAVVSRLYVHRNFKVDCFGQLLNLFSLLFCFACSWFMYGSLVFQYFFVGRLLFVTSFFIVDLIIEASILLIKKWKEKSKKNKLI